LRVQARAPIGPVTDLAIKALIIELIVIYTEEDIGFTRWVLLDRVKLHEVPSMQIKMFCTFMQKN